MKYPGNFKKKKKKKKQSTLEHKNDQKYPLSLKNDQNTPKS